MSYVLTCRTDRTDKNKLSDIQFLIHHQKEIYRIPTGEKCKPKSWDKDHHKVIARGSDHGVINNKLQRHTWALASILDAQPQFDIEYVRRRFKEYLSNPEGFDPKETIAGRTLPFSEIIDWKFRLK